MPGVRSKVTINDLDKGYRRLVGQLGEMGAVHLGVQGEKALEQHPNSELSVGEVAAIHELGLSGGHRTKRSWLVSWLDANQDRMMAETKAALQAVLRGEKTRKQALIDLGYRWTAELRDNIWDGKIVPALRQSTIDAKGHSIPLLDSTALVNAITYRIFLPALKSIRDVAQRRAARGRR